MLITEYCKQNTDSSVIVREFSYMEHFTDAESVGELENPQKKTR